MIWILFIYILSILLYIPMHKIANMYSTKILELEDRDIGIMFCPFFNTLIVVCIIIGVCLELFFGYGLWDKVKKWTNND